MYQIRISFFLGGTEYVKFVSRSIIDFYNKEKYFK